MNLLKGSFEGDVLWKKLLFTIIFAFGIMALGVALWYAAAFTYYQTTDIEKITSIIDSGSISVLKSLQFAQSLFLFVIPPFLLAYLWSAKPINYLGLNKKFSLESLVLAIAIMIFVLPFINLLVEINESIELPAFLKNVEIWMREAENDAAELTKKILQVNTFSGLMFNILLVAILPAVGEELFFRGVLQKIVEEKWGIHAGVWIAAIIFSAIHLQFYGFFARLLLGLVLGYMYVWSGSLWLPIAAHFTNNFLAVIAFYLMHNKFTDVDMDAVGTMSSGSWVSGIVSLVFFVGLAVLLYRSTMGYTKCGIKNEKNNHNPQ